MLDVGLHIISIAHVAIQVVVGGWFGDQIPKATKLSGSRGTFRSSNAGSAYYPPLGYPSVRTISELELILPRHVVLPRHYIQPLSRNAEMNLSSQHHTDNHREDWRGSNRHKTFIYKNGCKLHSFSIEEAPWPFSFNREVLEQ